MVINPLVETFWFGSYFHVPQGFHNYFNFQTLLWRPSKRQRKVVCTLLQLNDPPSPQKTALPLVPNLMFLLVTENQHKLSGFIFLHGYYMRITCQIYTSLNMFDT